MPDSLQSIKNIASNMMQRDRNWYKVAIALEAMGSNEWERPGKLKELTWLINRVDSSPRNAEIAGMRVFATMTPNPTLVRPSNKPETKKRYGHIENSLRYQFMKAAKRPGSETLAPGLTPVEKLLLSAMRFGKIAAQVIHIDAQLKLMGDINPNREKAIRQYGDFVINIHDPKNVHVRQSDLITEGVLLKKVQTLAEFVGFWGEKKAKSLLKDVDSDANYDKLNVCSYDYTDFETRAVWATVHGEGVVNYDAFEQLVDGVTIMHEEHNLPFLPWVARGGVEPLNYAVWKTGAWDAANVAETLPFSETITYAASPRIKKTGPNPDSIVIDYTQPGNPVNVPTGHDVEDMSPPQIDQAHVIMGDRARADIKAMTVPGVVQGEDPSSGTAFATYNQQLQSGLQAYAPFRELAERGLEEVFCHMLYWSKYLDKPISAPMARKGRGKETTYDYADGGFQIEPKHYDYDVEVMVELKPDMPVDRQAQITAASSGVQYLGWDRARANEMLGEDDPEQVEKDKAQEVLRDTKLQGVVLKQQAQDQLEAQAITAGLGQIIQYALDPEIGPMIVQMLQQFVGQIQQQQAAGAGQSGGESPVANPENSQTLGMDTVGGMGFDASQGGTPAATANPEGNTRAYQRGADSRGGQTL